MARRVILLAAILVGLGFSGAAPAAAEIDGPCSGSGAFEKGTKADGPFTVTAEDVAPGEVIEVPIKDTVHWQGSIDGVSGDREFSGFVEVDLPWPLGSATIDTWGGSTDKTGNEGDKSYNLPKAIPRGVEFEVTGEHSEDGTVVCSGTVKVKVEGGPFDSPLAPVGIGGTVVSGVGLAVAGLSKVAARGVA
jgi:hypothetical protein